MREYVRDKRSPKPKNAKVSEVMSANKAKNTKPELALRKLFWREGLRGYRVNYRGVPGRPDVAFTARKVAVFVNGCFWHRCPHCNYSLPKNNTAFWEKKFSANVARDKRKVEELEALGWKTYTVWECELGNEKKMDKLIKQLNPQPLKGSKRV